MKKMIYRAKSKVRHYTYRKLCIERDGFLKLASFETSELNFRRDMMVRRDAVVVLPVDFRKREVYLIEQPRHIRAFAESREGSMLLDRALRGEDISSEEFTLPREVVATLETPAGLIDEGETPEDAAVRELREETGLITDIFMLEKVAGPYYPSVGGTRERVTLYLTVLSDSPIFAGELSDEDQDRVTVWKLGFDEVFSLLREGRVMTASSNIIFRELFIRDSLRSG